MRFDPDCFRDVLIATESMTDGDTMDWYIHGPMESGCVSGLDAYPYNVAVYHINQCKKYGLIETQQPWIDGSFAVKDLTPQGHQMLAQLRTPSVVQLWRQAKEAGVLSSVGTIASWALGIVGMHLK